MTPCDKCGKDLVISEWPFCPHGFGNYNAVGDEIDVTIKHGLCHENGEPRRYRSRAEMKRVMKERGLVNRIEHIGKGGSDKSDHTTRWV